MARRDGKTETKLVTFQEVPDDWYALDIGPASTKLFTEAMQNAKTIIWNGPMGAFEIDAFSRGTYSMVESVVAAYALTIVGGGDTGPCVSQDGGIVQGIIYIYRRWRISGVIRG